MDMKAVKSMVKETGNALAKISGEDFLKMKQMDTAQKITLKFYCLLVSILSHNRT